MDEKEAATDGTESCYSIPVEDDAAPAVVAALASTKITMANRIMPRLALIYRLAFLDTFFSSWVTATSRTRNGSVSRLELTWSSSVSLSSDHVVEEGRSSIIREVGRRTLQ